jgi:hypothetical protein
MNITPDANYEYQVGSSLDADAPSYVKRQADEDLYKGLNNGSFCYVLNSRQMGKSSLRVQVMKRLKDDGVACAAIDLSANGTDITTEQWYLGVIDTLVNDLDLDKFFDMYEWWDAHSGLAPLQLFAKFIEEVLLKYIVSSIVIFLDEIDSVLSLKFSADDFFSLIRSFRNQRADKKIYNNLTFCLLGVVTPADLIQDKERTPFNIGRAIELYGFKLNEVEPLATGLAQKVDNPQDVLREILNWTGGQPFLTQKLCDIIFGSNADLESGKVITAGIEAEFVKKLVRSHIIDNWEDKDDPEHLRTIRDRIFRDQQRAGRLLGLYQQILQQGKVTVDESLEQMELRLSGLVVEQQGKLVVYNQIYQYVFNKNWVEKALADLRPYAEAIKAWSVSEYKDDSRLLRGQALQDALKWATGRDLSNEDYQFLNASQREARKLQSFKFKHGSAADISELIPLCEKYPDEAVSYLYNSYLEQWLVSHLGRTDLANISSQIIRDYSPNQITRNYSPNQITRDYKKIKRKGLEIFVRKLCKSENLAAYPKFSTKPTKLYFGKNPVGFQQNVELQISNNGRGFAWGSVELEQNLPGVRLTDKFDSYTDKKLYIQLDTLQVKPSDYEGSIVIKLEGIKEPCIIPIRYIVTKIQVDISPIEIDLGIVPHGEHSISRKLIVQCKPSNGKIKGIASTSDMARLKVKPRLFEGSFLELSFTLNTTFIEPGKYTYGVILKTNTGIYKVPISFRKPRKISTMIIDTVHRCFLFLLIISTILMILTMFYNIPFSTILYVVLILFLVVPFISSKFKK